MMAGHELGVGMYLEGGVQKSEERGSPAVPTIKRYRIGYEPRVGIHCEGILGRGARREGPRLPHESDLLL